MSYMPPVERHETAVPAPVHCKNCGALLLGRYCVDCSQAADVHVPTTKELLHELLEGLTHSDSRLWRTLKYLWFKPGELTREFVAGRRAAYLPPFRLYLVVSILFFLIASFVHTRGEILKFDAAAPPGAAQLKGQLSGCGDVNIDSHPDWTRRVQHACSEVVRDNGDSLLHVALAAIPKAMFIFLPLIAFLQMLMYRRPRHRYAEHLVFFVHLHAFFFSAAIVMLLAGDAAHAWPALTRSSNFLTTLLSWSLFLYSIVALRRVFNGSWLGTILKACALYIVYMVVLGITVAGVFVYALLQL